MYRILCFGKNSFIASQFESSLENQSIYIDWFSRGVESRIGNVVYGSIDNIEKNPFFIDNYDCVINFAILKNSSIDDNVNFIKIITNFCLKYKVKKFLHFSSPMVYSYNSMYIDEYSKIEDLNITWKGHYAKIKLATDKYLIESCNNFTFDICILRPGYVYEFYKQVKFSIKIYGNIRILLSDRKSVLPTICKKQLHSSLIKIIFSNNLPRVIHLFENGGTNKYLFTKNTYPRSFIISINYLLFLIIPKYLFKYSSKSRLFYSRIEGLFIQSKFYSYHSIKFLNKF